MSTRLPTPGGDNGTWGSILNSYLEVSHNTDGSLKGSAISQAGGITSASIGKANGIASLDNNGSVPVSQLGNLPAGNMPAATAPNQTVISNSSNNWTTTTAATVDTSDTPQPDTQLGSAGSGPKAAASDHSHPLNTLYNGPMFGFPPGYAYDLSFDGVYNGSSPGQWGYFGGVGNVATLSGSTYSLGGFIGTLDNSGGNLGPSFIMARNINISNGIICNVAPNYGTGNGVVMIASGTITIDGTLDASGADASGANGAVQNGSWAGGVIGNYQGYSGANGGTGAGSDSISNNTTSMSMVGGMGGAGGAGSNGAGGNQGGMANNGSNWFQWYSTQGIMFLMGNSGDPRNSIAPGPAGGGGGASGGGDGTNAGGGGGGGGGCILLIAPKIVIGSTAVLNVSGGKGAAGTGGNAGGGGGGGGGLVAMHGLNISIASGATINNAGGAGGAGSGTGTSGSPGNKGAFYDPPVSKGGYGFGAGCLICQWQ